MNMNNLADVYNRDIFAVIDVSHFRSRGETS